MNVFVYADMQSQINRCHKKAKKEENLTDKEIDKERKSYHKLISNIEWGDKSNYHICINTTDVEIKTIISSLADYIEEWDNVKSSMKK